MVDFCFKKCHTPVTVELFVLSERLEFSPYDNITSRNHPHIRSFLVRNYSNKSAANYPLPKESPEKEKNPYVCNICGKDYTLKHNLKRHIASHSGVKPFPCKVCGKYFKRKDTCLDHERSHYFNV